MNAPVANPDAPAADGARAASPRTAARRSVALSWTASTDNVGVARYNVHRSTTAWLHAEHGEPRSRSRRGRATPTRASPPGPTTTASSPRTRRATSRRRRTRRARVSATRRRRPRPGTLTATGAIGRATLGWGAATDAGGVVRYNVHRSTTPGFTPGAGNRIAQPTGTSYTDTGVTPGTYYYKVTAEDAAGNIGPPSNEASATVTADTTPPTAPVRAHRAGDGQHGEPDLDRVDRQRRRPPLQRPPRDDGRLHAERGEPDRPAHRHELQPTAGLPRGATSTRSSPRTPPGT